MKIVAGLGNPGTKYQRTRHNAGFKAVKYIARKAKIKNTDYQHHAIQAEGQLWAEKIVLAQPCTYMNKSGLAVKKLLQNYEVTPDDLIILHDDLDLPQGKIRIKSGGGSAGHRGLESIIEYLGTADFHRIRIGIGRPPRGVEVSHFVLNKFSEQEKEIMERAYEQIFAALECIFKEGLQAAMNQFN